MYSIDIENIDKNIAANMAKLFKETKKKKIDLANALGVVHTNITRYLDCTYSLSFKQLLIVSNFFDITLTELTGLEGLSPTITEDEYQLIKQYRNQTPEVQNAIKKILDIK